MDWIRRIGWQPSSGILPELTIPAIRLLPRPFPCHGHYECILPYRPLVPSYYISAAITAQSPNPYCINNNTDRDRISIPAGRTPRGTNSLTQNRIVCFRLDEAIDLRISRVIGARYSNRSRFIRTAIELLLAREEGQARLRDAQMTIQWG